MLRLLRQRTKSGIRHLPLTTSCRVSVAFYYLLPQAMGYIFVDGKYTISLYRKTIIENHCLKIDSINPRLPFYSSAAAQKYLATNDR